MKENLVLISESEIIEVTPSIQKQMDKIADLFLKTKK